VGCELEPGPSKDSCTNISIIYEYPKVNQLDKSMRRVCTTVDVATNIVIRAHKIESIKEVSWSKVVCKLIRGVSSGSSSETVRNSRSKRKQKTANAQNE
jgi:hypothetical protein